MGAAPVKTLVAQLWDEADLNGGEVEQFWKPCMESVETWASDNGFDYKRYTFTELEPLLPDLSIVEHLMTRWNRMRIAKIGMLNNTAYDKIIVVDADIIIYGNPQLGDASFGAHIEDRWFPQRVFPVFPYPHCGLYYSTRGPEVYQWCCDQFVKPSLEFEHIRLSYEVMAKQYELWDSSKRGNTTGEAGFGEQALLTTYTANHHCENISNHVRWGYEYSVDKMDFPEPNSFIHLCGDKKFKSYGKWKCFLLFQKLDPFYSENLNKLRSKGII